MEDYGKVSVIMASYNCSDFVAESIAGVTAQTYPDWELLVVDDCSTDDSCAVIERMAAGDPRIKLIRMAENGGAGRARNRAIEEATGRYIAICDSDDVWFPRKLEKQLRFMAETGTVLCYSSYLTGPETDCLTPGIVVCPRRVTYRGMLCDDKIGSSTAIYDTGSLGKVFFPLIRKRQDWGLMIRLLKRCRVARGLKEPLVFYRIREGSLSRKKIALVRYNIRVYHDVLKVSWPVAICMFAGLFLPSYALKRICQLAVNS